MNSKTANSCRTLMVIAGLLCLFAAFHHLDHVVRGYIVEREGLPAEWNHSGWPFQPTVTSFTFSLLIYPVVLGGILFTLRGKLWAGYWLATAVGSEVLAAFVHFVGDKAETPFVIQETYDAGIPSGGIPAILALVNLTVLLSLEVALAFAAINARRTSGHW